jgi:lysozyme
LDIHEQLQRDEGLRLRPYVDTVGKTTIGYGRNLIDKGISADEANVLLRNDVQEASEELNRRLPWFAAVDEVRQGVLVNMCFNMGFVSLEEFTKMIAAVAQGDWNLASQEMLNSLWAREVGDRATRLAEQMRLGIWQ